jgi:Fe(II)/alpha-ketoglutarate-dependent arginine beta-hydroxylase
MDILDLSSRDLSEVKTLIELLRDLPDPSDAASYHRYLAKTSIYAHKLPASIVDLLTGFKYNEDGTGACLIKGFEIDEAKIARTPLHWRSPEAYQRTKEEEALLLVCSALLGDAIGWSTQQDGKIVHNIVPIEGDEDKQVGSSTSTTLWWHTEEAFHPLRCDYIVLFCLRNRERAATTYASVNSLRISPADKAVLFEPNYRIRPDSAHLTAYNAGGAVDERKYKGVHQMNEDPEKISVLYGDFDTPYLRIDPYYMEMNIQDAQAEAALNNIVREIDRNLQYIVLEPGDMLFLDNYRTVHGRNAFKTSFDGKGRWLKRLNIVRDLRKSRQSRKPFYSRIIETA